MRRRRETRGPVNVSIPKIPETLPMRFTQELIIGFGSPVTLLGSGALSSIQNEIDVLAAEVDNVGSFAGSTHVLKMGQHYTDYVSDGVAFPSVTTLAKMPPRCSIEQLETKGRAADVTGNIGESIAGMVAQRTFKLPSSQIAHLKVRNSSKTPDFLLYDVSFLNGLLKSIIPVGKRGTLPLWWPLESKARSGDVSLTVAREALKQLASYWDNISLGSPQAVGYGVIVASAFNTTDGATNPKRVCIHILLPDDAALLTKLLNDLKNKPKEQKETLDALLYQNAFLKHE